VLIGILGGYVLIGILGGYVLIGILGGGDGKHRIGKLVLGLRAGKGYAIGEKRLEGKPEDKPSRQ